LSITLEFKVNYYPIKPSKQIKDILNIQYRNLDIWIWVMMNDSLGNQTSFKFKIMFFRCIRPRPAHIPGTHKFITRWHALPIVHCLKRSEIESEAVRTSGPTVIKLNVRRSRDCRHVVPYVALSYHT